MSGKADKGIFQTNLRELQNERSGIIRDSFKFKIPIEFITQTYSNTASATASITASLAKWLKTEFNTIFTWVRFLLKKKAIYTT